VSDREAAAAPEDPSLVVSLRNYIKDLPEDERADALHQVFYGFYTRVAIIDRATHALASWVRDDLGAIEDLPESLAEALRGNGLFVGQELFASRVRAMAAMGHLMRPAHSRLIPGARCVSRARTGPRARAAAAQRPARP
jgi:hypothetical protein